MVVDNKMVLLVCLDQVPVKTLPNLEINIRHAQQIWVPNRPSALTTMAMVF